VAWPARRQAISIPPCDIYSFERSTLLASAFYYDRATVFAQLGVFREPIGWVGQVGLVLNIR
jgi:hypothetical protein